MFVVVVVVCLLLSLKCTLRSCYADDMNYMVTESTADDGDDEMMFSFLYCWSLIFLLMIKNSVISSTGSI